MKKITLITLVLLLTCLLTAQAGPIDQQKARQLAAQFMQKKGLQLKGEPRRAPGVSGTGSNEAQPLYIFNTDGAKGFVIVAGDDRADAILGYSTEGSYDEQNLPDNFRYYLQLLSSDMQALMASNATATTRRTVETHKAIDPLIQTRWNQGNATADGFIYNTMCPTLSGKHCLTGCVATAGAQIMYYYQYPKSTEGVGGYQIEDQEPSINTLTKQELPATTFNWSQMKKTYSESDQGTDAQTEVAKLMIYAGYAAQMNYGLDGSSASILNLSEGMAKYFDYDPYTYRNVNRSDYTINEWDNLMYNELAEGRPIIYSGNSAVTHGGHAFICDGYDGNGLYHFNWGWGGSNDGYFKLCATNPYGGSLNGNYTTLRDGYVNGIYAVIGIQPNTGIIPETTNNEDEWEEETIDGIVATASNTGVNETTISMQMSNNNGQTYKFSFGIGEIKEDGTLEVVGTKNVNYSEIPDGYGYSNITYDISTYNLSIGKHKIVPISLLNGETEWKQTRPASVYFDVDVVTDNSITIVAHPVEKIRVNTFEVINNTSGEKPTIKLNITNEGDNLEKYLYIYTDDDNNYCGWIKAKIKAGNTKEYSFTTWNEMATGDHTFNLCGSQKKTDIISSITVNFDLDLQSTNFSYPGNKLTISTQQVDVTIKNNAGEYKRPLYLFASKTASKGSYVYLAGTAIESNESEVVTFHFRPTSSGTWNLWVATDVNGNNIIGESSVEISDPPTGEVSLTLLEEKDCIFGNDEVSMTFKIKNTGDVTNYREIGTWIYIRSNSEWSCISYKEIPAIIIEPDETKELSITYDGLEDGSEYRIVWGYCTTAQATGFTWLDSHEFTFDANATAIILPETDRISNDETYYTLSGQRLNSRPTKAGIYIHKGKKVIVR